jgi:hypothetical protein
MSAVCHESVIRKGEDQPCHRPAVTYRLDPREEFRGEDEYPVCRRHAGPMALGLTLTRAHQPLAGFPLVGAVLAEGLVMGC